MATLQSLAKRLEKAADDLPEKANNLAKAAVRAMIADLVWATPVDTSKAMSNWVASLDAPPSGDIPAHSPGFLGYTAAASAAQAIADAESVLASKRPGQPIYVSNAAPYIGELDRGSSRQFAGGFVPRAVLVAKEAIKGAQNK